LAAWWPLISPPHEYAEEAAFLAGLLRSATVDVHTVLELGSGGGNNASHLSPPFELTLVDSSSAMLAVSRALNPSCRHVEGDMRSVRLGGVFDAVLVHDAVAYMTTEADLQAAAATAFEHCRPGGVAVFLPDHVRETFAASTEHGGSDGCDGRAARYLLWEWDPEPSDTWTEGHFAFMLRDTDGSVRVVYDVHRWGLFATDTWRAVLETAGFLVREVVEPTTDPRPPRVAFVASRPQTARQ
jgi:SAM-dependent methyltransferase